MMRNGWIEDLDTWLLRDVPSTEDIDALLRDISASLLER